MRRWILLSVVVVAMTAGCGGDDSDDDAATGDTAETTATTAESDEGTTATTAAPSDTGGEDVDVCGLLSEAEASEFLGAEVTAEELHDAVGSYGVCEWGVPAEGFYRARLTVGPADLYDVLKSNEATDLDGLGDEAWFYSYGANGEKLDLGVRTGEYHVLLFLDPIADQATGEAMMHQIVEGLDA